MENSPNRAPNTIVSASKKSIGVACCIAMMAPLFTAVPVRAQLSERLCSSPALAIPDNDPTGVSDTIVISDSGIILDMTVSIDITHTWAG